VSKASSLAGVLPPEALADGLAGEAVAAAREGAEAIVRPASTDEVAQTLRWAAANGVGVMPVGSGERAPSVRRDGSFLLLSSDRLRGLEIYEPADVTFTARAGTPLTEIGTELGVHRQWLPFDPPNVSRRTLGGLVASGESGPVGTGYGELRNHVLGATVVCGDGRVLRLGGRVVKNVAGFDLLRPVVGSRGRLGVITSLCLRACPSPDEDRVLALRADAISDLAEVARAVRTAPVLPASSVLWVPASAGESGAVLVVRLHGPAPAVAADQETLERRAGIAFETGMDDLVRPARDGAVDGAVTVRLSVLPSKLFECLALARERLGGGEIVADTYAGRARVALDGVDPGRLGVLQEKIEALGGALSVETVSGGLALEELGTRSSRAERELTAQIERVFDPEGVFWPCRA
jgi:glycolate oxidase FAD binding subunit